MLEVPTHIWIGVEWNEIQTWLVLVVIVLLNLDIPSKIVIIQSQFVIPTLQLGTINGMNALLKLREECHVLKVFIKLIYCVLWWL